MGRWVLFSAYDRAESLFDQFFGMFQILLLFTWKVQPSFKFEWMWHVHEIILIKVMALTMHNFHCQVSRKCFWDKIHYPLQFTVCENQWNIIILIAPCMLFYSTWMDWSVPSVYRSGRACWTGSSATLYASSTEIMVSLLLVYILYSPKLLYGNYIVCSPWSNPIFYVLIKRMLFSNLFGTWISCT